MLAGTAATAVATALLVVHWCRAAGGLVGALVGLGIPEGRANVNDRLSRGDYLVFVDGTNRNPRTATSAIVVIQEWGMATIAIPKLNAAIASLPIPVTLI